MRMRSPIPHKKARIEIIPLIDIMFFLLASFMLVAIPAVAEDKASGFFNGKDIDNWEGLKEFWEVKDGAIVGTTPAGM